MSGCRVVDLSVVPAVGPMLAKLARSDVDRDDLVVEPTWVGSP
jgi:hypothetical protein